MNAQLMKQGAALAPVEQSEAKSLVVQPLSASPLDLPAEVFRAGLDRRKQNRAALMEWIRAALVEGVDYGRIHIVKREKCAYGRYCTDPKHFSKPSLFKPGAEKICGMLGVTVHYPTLPDYEQTALRGVQLQNIILRCEIVDAAGRMVADGVGARSIKQDGGDINKALKMAEKSAHIDATLRMAGLSEVFTQDLEDMHHGQNMEDETGSTQTDGVQQAEAQEAAAERINPAQHRRLEARIGELGLECERVKAWLSKATRGRVAHFNDLTPAMYEQLDAKLDEWARQQPAQAEGMA